VTITETVNQRRTTRTVASRVAAGASVLFAVCFFGTVASIDMPHGATDSEVLDWWREGGNQFNVLISMVFAIATAILFTVVVNHVRELAAQTGPAYRSVMNFAHSMATAFCAVMLVSAAVRGVVGIQVKVIDEPLPGVDVLRFVNAFNYALIGFGVMTVLALSMLSISVVVLRTHFLARWIGIMGVVCGLIIAAATAATFGPFAISIALLWSLGLAVAIWRQPAG
jgi:hypothetical protein